MDSTRTKTAAQANSPAQNKIPQLSLGTNGVRAKFNLLNAQSAADFAFAFGLFTKKESKMKNPAVALARDMRLTSPCIHQAAASGLMESGCNALDLGILTSPASEWAAQHEKCQGLIIVTASHNPPEWNALKFVDKDGIAVSRERGKDFNKFLSKPHEPSLKWNELGTMRGEPQIIQKYQQAVLQQISKSKIKPLKIIADPGNGTATLVAPKLLQDLGAELKVINKELDGTFPNRPSEPIEKNLSKLISEVKKEKADFGVAWDGDADRVSFVDEKGRWIVGDKCVAICAKWALLNEKNPQEKIVATTSATSKVVEDVASQFGAKTIYTDVGAPYLAEKMHANLASIAAGGEEVGGIVFPKFSLAKDGVFAACKLMEMASLKPVSKWVDELPSYFNSKTKIEAGKSQKEKAIKSILAKLKAQKEGALLPLIGGFRLNLQNEWVLVRASGTEDYIRIFAESSSQKGADSLMSQYTDLVQKAL
ncbi:MAG: phosphoglucosamine mutase [Candidatus Micrarchaeota archaeon]